MHLRAASARWFGPALALALGCSSPPPPPAAPSPPPPPPQPARTWLTPLDASSPLVGKAWDARAHALVPLERAQAALNDARFVLLGEKHDNPDHHRLQADFLAALIAHGRRPAVVFEMIDRDQQPAVDAYLARADATVDGLAAVLEWDRRGWPAWSIYRPIFAVAFAAHLKLVGGGLGRDVTRAIMRGGPASALPPDHVARLHLEPLSPEQSASLEAEIRAAHCGALPDAMVAPMSVAQRVKDAVMADLLLANGAADGAVLIAGDGHVRTDRGVPEYLRRAQATSVVVSFLEVRKSAPQAATYAEAQPSDFVVFTPRLDDDDPCAKFRHR